MLILQILGIVGPILGAVLVAAVKIGRAYGNAEAQAAQYRQDVAEFREQVRKLAARTGLLERETDRRGGRNG